MTASERAEFVHAFINEHCLKVLDVKGSCYSRAEEDVNSNFKRVGFALGLNPVKVAYVYLAKHLDSIASFIKNGNAGGEPIEGRLGDAINYMLIIGSLIKEQANEAIHSE